MGDNDAWAHYANAVHHGMPNPTPEQIACEIAAYGENSIFRNKFSTQNRKNNEEILTSSLPPEEKEESESDFEKLKKENEKLRQENEKLIQTNNKTLKMLEAALEFCERVKRSRVGKVFFAKQLNTCYSKMVDR